MNLNRLNKLPISIEDEVEISGVDMDLFPAPEWRFSRWSNRFHRY